MPINSDFRVKEGPQSFSVLPADDYQAVITDVNEVLVQKWQSQDQETQLRFTLTIITDGYIGRKVWYYCRPVFSPSKPGKNPSKLFEFLKAIWGYKDYQVKIDDLLPSDIDANRLSALIGSQVLVTLDVYPGKDGFERNKITFLRKIKEEILFDPALIVTDEPAANKEPNLELDIKL